MITRFLDFKSVKLQEDVFSATYSPDEHDYAYDPGDTTDANRDQLPVGLGDGEEETDADYQENDTHDDIKEIEVTLRDIKQLIKVIADRIEKLES